MIRRDDRFRRGISAAAALLTLGVSVAVPVLERDVFLGETAVESHHDASRCAQAHDHRVCTQVGANLSLLSAESGHDLSAIIVRVTARAEMDATPGIFARVGPPPRAPPLA